MAIKWVISPRSSDSIKPIEVISETKCFVTVLEDNAWGKKRERRMHKNNDYEQIHDTFDSAKKALIDYANQRIINAELALQEWKNKLEKRMELKN